MKTATISKSAVKKALIEILKEEPDILRSIQREYFYPPNVATKDDLKMVVDMMDKRFESLIREMNARFEAMDKRFNDLKTLIMWLAGVTTTSLIGIIGILVKMVFFGG